MLRSILTVAQITYKEIIRERLLLGILLVAVLLTSASFFMATISLDQDARVLQDTGTAAIHLFAFFITIFVATNSMSKDLDRRALYLLLPKPLSRGQYILGKYFGLLLLLKTTLGILGGLFVLGLLFMNRSLIPGTLIDLAYSFLEIGLMLSFAILFATFTAPLNAALYTSALFIIGHSLVTIREYAVRQGVVAIQHLISACYYVLPNLDKFDVRRAVLYGLYPNHQSVLWSVLYGIIYTSLVLWLAIIVIRKREV